MTANRDLLFKAAYQQIDQGYPRPRSEEAAPNFNYDQHNPLRSTAPADRPLTLVATTDDYESFSRYRLLESRLHVAAIDEHGELSLSRRIANDPGSVLELFGCSAAFAGETQVPVEATYGWEWLAELLEDAGYEPDLAHRCARSQVVWSAVTHSSGWSRRS